MDLWLFLFVPSLFTPLLLQFYFAVQFHHSISPKLIFRETQVFLWLFPVPEGSSHPHISNFPFLPKTAPWYQFYNFFTLWRNPCSGNSLAFSVTHIKFFVLLSFEEGLVLPIIWYLWTKFLSFLPPFCLPPFPTISFWLCLVYVLLSL